MNRRRVLLTMPADTWGRLPEWFTRRKPRKGVADVRRQGGQVVLTFPNIDVRINWQAALDAYLEFQLRDVASYSPEEWSALTKIVPAQVLLGTDAAAWGTLVNMTAKKYAKTASNQQATTRAVMALLKKSGRLTFTGSTRRMGS